MIDSVQPEKRPLARAVPRHRKPDEMSLAAWQVALRRQFADLQRFAVENLGGEPVFSEFRVTNPETKRAYRVAIRGEGLSENFCSCPDFAVNTLGTCKHIEYVLKRLRRNRDARRALASGFRPADSEIYLRYGARREVFFRPGEKCPCALKELAESCFDSSGRLRSGADHSFPLFLKKAQSLEPGLRCYDDALAFISQVRGRAELIRRVEALFPDGAEDAALEALLKVGLYPYQRQGALFAARAGRCLIADEMGLGKTVQAIAAAEILARAVGVERVLIVCPTSLKQQWKNEIAKFAGREALVVEGLLARRTAQYAGDGFCKIVNYDVIHRDLPLIQRWRPELVILDEAQRIKNWKTRAARSVKQIDSDYAFVLTGTPLENRLEELHSIVEFVDRFHLGPLFRFLSEHQHVDETGRVIGYRNLSGIAKCLSPILIRRTKQEVLKELPERLEKRFFVPMTEEQMQHHEENREIVAKLVAKWRRRRFLSEADQLRLTCALQNMRMSCDSTYLLDGETDHGKKADELATLLDEVLETPDAKVVIFSQWLRMHELIARRLARRRWEHVLFHGGVPGPKRKDLIRRFQESPSCRLFLSTDAGGVGLNLQNASTIVNMDLPWNPAVLEQRIGRVHRLGQHRPVRVVHFISQGTIEERMLGLLSFKQSVFTGVLDGGQDEVFLGGTRLNRFMESVDKATAAAPAPAAGPVPPQPAAQGEAHELPPAAGSVASQQQAIGDLCSAGAAFLDQLGRALGAGRTREAQPGGGGPLKDLIGRDGHNGQPYLKIPIPPQEALHRIAELLSTLAHRS